MKTLIVKDQEVILDDEDYDRLCILKWCVINGYAKLTGRHTSSRYMHHHILPKKIGFDVDHVDRNKLNNSRSNLRYATRSENKLNSDCTLRRNLPPRIYRKSCSYVGRFCFKGKQYGTQRCPSVEEAQAALSALMAGMSA